jgi:hypothetical protein
MCLAETQSDDEDSDSDSDDDEDEIEENYSDEEQLEKSDGEKFDSTSSPTSPLSMNGEVITPVSSPDSDRWVILSLHAKVTNPCHRGLGVEKIVFLWFLLTILVFEYFEFLTNFWPKNCHFYKITFKWIWVVQKSLPLVFLLRQCWDKISKNTLYEKRNRNIKMAEIFKMAARDGLSRSQTLFSQTSEILRYDSSID